MERTFLAQDYDLDATLTSGQAFRWRQTNGSWESVVDGRWVRLSAEPGSIHAVSAAPAGNWQWLRRYLCLDEDIGSILSTFPDDDTMKAAVCACRGLRLLRQPPWECLASFILSSSKRITQISEAARLLCERFGHRVPAPSASAPAFAFPSAERIASCDERELIECKMGFRAAYLLETARIVASGGLVLEELQGMPIEAARESLMRLPGVGAKIANCVLLFAFRFDTAFPVDVWIARVLRSHYFGGRNVSARETREFAATYFGPHAGYAQQYLYHFIRTRGVAALPGSHAK